MRAPRVQRLCCIVAAVCGRARGCSEFRETSSLPSWPQPHHTATGCPRCHRRASRRATSWTCPCPHNCSRGAASGRSTQRPPALSGRGGRVARARWRSVNECAWEPSSPVRLAYHMPSANTRLWPAGWHTHQYTRGVHGCCGRARDVGSDEENLVAERPGSCNHVNLPSPAVHRMAPIVEGS